ncbi:MAG: DUF2997 domain-containing protein [Planctomycetota bacterium]|nr:MAG: DUF2997 domain-containing protein [Planctomycetota bacterium]
MSKPEFEILIDKQGRMTVEIKGVKGPRCLEYADLLREIVGHEEARRLTADFYAPEGKVRFHVEAQESTGEGG